MISHTVGFYSVKILAIFIISVMYFVTGSIFSLLLDQAIPNVDPKSLSSVVLMLETGVIFGIIGVIYYLNRMMLKYMPFFLDGFFGFRHILLHDMASGMIIGYILYAYQDKLIEMLKELRIRYQRIEQTIRNLF
uniref:Uncharacterized protein n=1 Tax=viral metagenome TaxID=1070528 RepID=A0A6C0KRX6_9ZZZZ